MGHVLLFFEYYFIFCLFLITDIRAYGYRNKYIPKELSVVLFPLVPASLEILLMGDVRRYFMDLLLLVAAGIVYTLVFSDAHAIYSISLQLELICCFTALKSIWINLLSGTPGGTPDQSVSVLTIYIPFVLSMILCSYFFSSHTLKAPFDPPYKYYVIITFIPLVLLALSSFLIYESADSRFPLYLMNLPVILLLLLTHYLSWLHISSYNELVESRIINQHMELLQSHVERSSALVEQIRRDKHEMKNVYFYIHSLLRDKSYDELENYVNDKLLHRYDRLEEFNTGYKIIDYLMSQKACEAIDAGISLVADIRLPDHLYIDRYELCSLLNNILDNAIDASKPETNKDIQIKMAQQKNYLAITVKNRTSFDVLKVNPNLCTTKDEKESHGIGTRVVRRIVEKYDGAIDYAMDAGYFVVHVLLINDDGTGGRFSV